MALQDSVIVEPRLLKMSIDIARKDKVILLSLRPSLQDIEAFMWDCAPVEV
eukprot:CAMPEP_0204901476 /NCGR_PEP_ID=MMETSP1397-20131031/3103_1 /ASSEMBLY_ACC=CAM_ASM_000891 /TAXON_ID=49980 /ORGANISM="Climacostomum Climacostomum virens, Strain Stock W-24" /LENGTH=50 /DNA_ID=CAMNT_0052069839 /DNA_START=431 /DNA_END=583 /DNA_ORIENTATION=+